MPAPALMSFSYMAPIATPTQRLATDPVCGGVVDTYSACSSAAFGGEIYYFCSSGCHARFTRQPALYRVDQKN
ncbi:MAG: hypothetical protein ACJ8J7_03940 [Sulfurifustaceae bacterium]